MSMRIRVLKKHQRRIYNVFIGSIVHINVKATWWAVYETTRLIDTLVEGRKQAE